MRHRQGSLGTDQQTLGTTRARPGQWLESGLQYQKGLRSCTVQANISYVTLGKELEHPFIP